MGSGQLLAESEEWQAGERVGRLVNWYIGLHHPPVCQSTNLPIIRILRVRVPAKSCARHLGKGTTAAD